MSAQVYLGIVIVTHNHGRTIDATLTSIVDQTRRPDEIVVVDCASENRRWMEHWRGVAGLRIVELETNAGFTGGNNVGWRLLSRDASGFVAFVNPDVVLPRADLLERLLEVGGRPDVSRFGAWTPRLVGWDFERKAPTGMIDSTGIFPRFPGRWEDRKDGADADGDRMEEVPAICGAFFMARTAALRAAERRPGELWDERYFAYKEDIELSLRLRRAGWRLGVWHGAEAGHGRGWTNRREMSRAARLLSARNELRLHWTYARARVPLSVTKWLAVRLLNL